MLQNQFGNIRISRTSGSGKDWSASKASFRQRRPLRENKLPFSMGTLYTPSLENSVRSLETLLEGVQ